MPLSIFFSHRTGKRFAGHAGLRKKFFVGPIDDRQDSSINEMAS